VTTDLGSGDLPLRGIVDIDNRGAPAADDPKRLLVDSTVDPLPKTIQITFEPSGLTDPMHLVYKSPAKVNVDTSVRVATGPANECGQDRVICALARVDRLPPDLDIKLPGKTGTDFNLHHTGIPTELPDVYATVDAGPDSTKSPAAPRTWAKVALLGIPNDVTGRLDTSTGEVRAAEFHGCSYRFTAPTGCTPPSTQGAIKHVAFTIRDQPQRVGLPPRPDLADQFVSLISRHKAPGPKNFEVVGAVDAVRNVVFHQLDQVANDGKTTACWARWPMWRAACRGSGRRPVRRRRRLH